jgi:hypothetical protein
MKDIKIFSKIVFYLKQAAELSEEIGLGDIFNYSKVKEVMMAMALGHNIVFSFSGPDGKEPDGKEAEYKSTISKTIKATYNGISVQESWEKQLEYLKKHKIGKYKHHYYARFTNGVVIAELWRLDSDDVLKILIPKLKKQYHSEKKRKDPRLGASITSEEILQYGKKMIEVDGIFIIPNNQK